MSPISGLLIHSAPYYTQREGAANSLHIVSDIDHREIAEDGGHLCWSLKVEALEIEF